MENELKPIQALVNAELHPEINRFFNCHAHCFTMSHVPEYFFSKALPVNTFLNKKWVKDLVKNGPVTGKLPFLLKVFLWILGWLNLMTTKEVVRLLAMIRFGNTESQEVVIKSLSQYYPKRTGYALLTMDMEYMGAGIPKVRFKQQVEELAALKKGEYADRIYPFIFVDPRRIEPQTDAEREIESTYSGKNFVNDVEQKIVDGSYTGIKIYPALGYFPFDMRMKVTYDLAIKYDLPLISHCTMGTVHHKYKMSAAERIHPITKVQLPDLKPIDYQQFLTHPLNYKFLLEQEELKKSWGNDAPDYSNLKFCLGHWGSREDWHRYLESDWADLIEITKEDANPALEAKNWRVNPKESHLNFTWFTIIYEMLKSERYPNLYTDISYTLYDHSLLPMLKVMLESNKKVREHVLFGTDFYLVSKAMAEREYSIHVRAFLGDKLFNQIAVINARRYLSNKLYQVK